MKPSRSDRVRRLLGDLRRDDTRGAAMGRIRRRLGREVGRVVGGGSAAPATPAGSGADIAVARRHEIEATFAEAIARGESLEAATCAAMRAIVATDDWGDWNAGYALALGIARLPGGETAAALGHGILLHHRRQLARTWRALRGLDDATLRRHVPVEAVDGALGDGSAEARDRARAIAADHEGLGAAELVDLAGRFLVIGDREVAAALLAELEGRPTADLDERRRRSWHLVEAWLKGPGSAPSSDEVPIGVMTYRTPDHGTTSGNLGDLIQSLAAVGNLVRFSNARFSGDDGLGSLATALQARVPAALRLDGPARAVRLVAVDRDASSLDEPPAGTWLLAFGWHMHPLYDLRYDFPYHPHLRPIFVSFHVNRLDMLDERALAYLREHGPIGCRDWTTVFLLLGAGVDAFFSGCVSSTIDGLFPSRSESYRGGGPVGVIDQPAASAAPGVRNVRTYSHQSERYRSLGVTEGLRVADAALAGYQRTLDRAVTGRLHAYLPLTALGIPVEFRTRYPGDPRFAGLSGLRPGDPRLAEMQDGLRELIGETFGDILGGADEAGVYARWRERTAARVAEAKARFEAPLPEPTASTDVAELIAGVRAATTRFGPHDQVDPARVTDVALSYDQNLLLPAAVLVESLLASASGPLRLWILSRGLDARYQAWLARAFPDLPITFLPCDDISYGPDGRPRRVTSRITVSTMDRVFLPDLLADVPRVVYLDVDTIALADITELARTDLSDRPLAATDSNVTEDSEWQRAGRRMSEELALELRRRMARDHGFGHPALNAGVLVLDLDWMRRDDFSRRALGWIERYGLHDQDTMLFYVGPDRATVDSRWNAMPRLEDLDDPAIIHWASFNKPWDPPLTYADERWAEHAERLHARAGDPPGTASDPAGAAPGTLANPIAVGATEAPQSDRVEAVIAGVRSEHLSYLDETSLRTLAATVAEADADGIDGLVIEAGVARGGSGLTMAAAKSPDRRMQLYDVFGMIPEPGDHDGEDVHKRYRTIRSGKAKGVGGETYYGYRPDLRDEVIASFARHGLEVGANHVELVQGRFEETMTGDEPVAVAHLDGDWYASTMACLTNLAPRLAVGGRIILDDYDTWSGCRTAVHDYFEARTGYRFERRGRLHVVREATPGVQGFAVSAST